MERVLTVLAQGDADGVSSAAVVKAALAGEYEAVRVYFTHPVDLAKDFEAFAEGDVYIVDVAIDKKTTWGAGCRGCTAELCCTAPSESTSTTRMGGEGAEGLG